MRQLVETKADVIRTWIAEGKIAPLDPVHLLFMIWATTQHYADFDVQVHAVLDQPNRQDHFEDAARHLDQMFRRMVDPRAKS